MTSALHALSSVFQPLRRNPGFSVAMIVTLALGIAPNVVIFTIMDAIYFRPLPYPGQERMVLLNVARKSDATLAGVDGYTFAEWQARAGSFERLAAYRNAGVNLRVGERVERLAGQVVTGDFFGAVGMAPALGRGITGADCVPGAPAVLVISHRTWQEVFGGRADIVNLAVRLNGGPASIVGVMPPAFTSFMEGRAAAVWAPLALRPAQAPGGTDANVVGRLKKGVTKARAQAELSAVETALAGSFPETLRERRVIVRDFRSALFGGLGPGLRMLAIVVGLLLLIACANAANLLLGRASGRARDVALRTAVGASRGRLVRALLTESLVLALAASCCGLTIASWATRFIWSRSGDIFTRIGVNGFPFDGRVAVFTVGLTALAVGLFGFVPAFRGSRANLAELLKSGSAGGGANRRAGRLSRGLVVGQVTLCVVTLVVTAMMVRSFLHFSAVSSNPGFDPTSLLVASLPLSDEGSVQVHARQVARRDIEERLAAEPGIGAVAITNRLPFLESGVAGVVQRSARAGDATPARFDVEARLVNASYFDVLSVRMVKGRALDAHDDRQSQPVVVIDERLAAAWGTADPVGEEVTVDGVARTIVGVVSATTEPSPFRPAPREVFLPYTQASASDMKLVVRSRLAEEAAAAAVRRGVAAVDPDQPLSQIRPLSRALDDFMTPFRLILSLIALFGATALGLAALGLYSVMARGVSRRTREIGIRMAMGASRQEIVGMMMREGLRPALTGLVLGLLLGLAIARLLPSGILGVGGLVAWQYLASAVLWLAAAAGACLVPARRSAAVEPVTALCRE